MNALILGSSSGYGGATAVELAKSGYDIYGVHLDFGSGKKNAEAVIERIKATGASTLFFNENAADESNRKHIIKKIKEDLSQKPDKKIKVFLHSLAFGAIGPFIDEDPAKELNQKKMEMTLNVMANCLLYWTQDLLHNDLMAEGGRILSLTSVGSNRSMKNYGAMSVAKAALEAHTRQLAIELAPYKITCNTIMAGICDTPASSKIPGFDRLLEFARMHHPYRRNSMPEDIAKSISLLVDEKAYWINGQIIAVDGGESIYNTLLDIKIKNNE